uniref:Uncharacterized protein n=1 Tax=Aegilops tauschii TaxID=37682 RepID=N1QS36_AEGTA
MERVLKDDAIQEKGERARVTYILLFLGGRLIRHREQEGHEGFAALLLGRPRGPAPSSSTSTPTHHDRFHGAKWPLAILNWDSSNK